MTAPTAASRERARKLLLKRLGAKVHALRKERGLPRHALAEGSGVSLRFLSQLEGGAGNISVARLADVAHALRSTPAELLSHGDGDKDAPLMAALGALLDGRSEAELQKARAFIEARLGSAAGAAGKSGPGHGAHAAPAGPLVALLGVRGAGKSSVGSRLAKRLGLPFHELDALIEEAAGLSLAQIFELHGEAYYRKLERETLSSLLAGTRAAVLATGGSLVNDRETFGLLRRRCHTVWLRARPEDHWNRVVKQGDARPMARHPQAMQELKALLAARGKLYGEADDIVDTTGITVEAVVEKVARLVREAQG